MNCPRCKTAIERPSDPDGVVTCPGCGARLMTRSAALRSGATRTAPLPSASGAASAAPKPPISLASQLSPSATLPPTPLAQVTPPPPVRQTPRPGFIRAAPRVSPGGASSAASGTPSSSGVAPATPATPATPAPSAGAAGEADESAVAKTLELILDQLRELSAGQRELRELLQRAGSGIAARGSAIDADDDQFGAAQARVGGRKSVLLIDDDPQTREAAVAAFGDADVPVRAYDDGNAALSAIGEEKPDAIVLELALGGEMAGKDVINMIKATMEWVDIPIVLWTRESVSNQKEARQIHGADELVLKSAGVGSLVNRVAALFRRG